VTADAPQGTVATAAPATSLSPTMRPIDWVLLIAPGLMWGTSFLFIKVGLEAFPAALITPMRVGIGFCVLGMFPAARRSVPRDDLKRIALLGVVWMAVPLTMFPFAEQHVSSSVTGMLNGATPLFVAGVASLLARRLPPRRQMLGLFVGTFGVVMIALPTLNDGSSSWVGVAQIIFALSCYGVALNLAVPLQQRHGSLPVLWRALGVAFVLTMPFGLTTVGDVHFAWASLFAMLGLGVLGTSFAYVLASNNAGRLGSTRASVTTYIIPVVSLLLGALIRDETVAVLAVVGCAIALFGAWLAGRRH